jgi:enterochelin esterase-like enzyme
MSGAPVVVLSGAVEEALRTGGADAVRALARSSRGPLVEPGVDPECYQVTFVYAERREQRRGVGLFCPAVPGGYARLRDLGAGTFAGTFPVPRGTRVTYHFCPDPPDDPTGDALFTLAHSPTARRIDYFNPVYDQVHIPSIRVRMLESLLAVPGARPAPPTRRRAGVAPGTVEQLTVHSDALGWPVPVELYLPAGYTRGGRPYPLVVLAQSNEEWRPAGFYDNLLADGSVPPFVGVLLGGGRMTARFRALASAAYARFVVDELLPAVAARVELAGGGHTVAGYSAGGLGAASVCLAEPVLFPRLALLSAALHLRSPADVLRRVVAAGSPVVDRFREAASLPAQVYIAAGRFEDPWQPAIYRLSESLAGILDARGVRVRFDTGPTGHDTVAARGYLADGLGWLLGAASPTAS